MDTSTWDILLVDDEVEFITTLADRLDIRGIPSRTVHDGESALRAVAEKAPQVMVLDVMMQGMTRDGIEGMRYGAFAYLTKPLDLEELITTMGEAISASRGQAHD
jgi:DNA-binding response OmpR family regulator